jgi:hypothetical protein
VTIEVYNKIGQKIVTLIGQPMTSGRHQVVFNGTPLSSGIYYYKIEAGNFRDIKKMILIK